MSRRSAARCTYPARSDEESGNKRGDEITSGVESQRENFASALASASGSVAGRRASGVCCFAVGRGRGEKRYRVDGHGQGDLPRHP